MAAITAVLSIVLSCLCLSTATDSSGGEIDPSLILLTIQDIATNMAVNQLAILRILSDSPTTVQAVLQQCRNETQAASEALEARINQALEARINQYEIQLNQTGQTVLQQWNEAQAASAALEARINQNKIQLSQNRQEALQQRNEAQAASEAVEARIDQNEIQLNQTRQDVNKGQAAREAIEARINQNKIQLSQTRQEVLQQRNKVQVASEAVEARINQNKIQLNQTRQAVLQQCRNEAQVASEALKARINLNKIQLSQTRHTVLLLQQRNETQVASEALEARINQNKIQLSRTRQAVLQQCRNVVQVASEELEARINQNKVQLSQTRHTVLLLQQRNETQFASEALEARVNQNRIQLSQAKQAVLQLRNEAQAASKAHGARINQNKIKLRQTRQVVMQQWNEDQAASEALEARINQNKIQLSQNSVALNETGEEVLQHCRREVQTATASLETKIQQIINQIQDTADRQEVPQVNQGEIQKASTTLQTVIQFPESENTWNNIEASMCSGIKELRGTSGILMLTSSMYIDNKDCEWTIVAPEGSVLDIQWIYFHLEDHNDCNNDWVKVVDLYRPNELVYGQKLCGSLSFLNASSWITSGNKLKVTFHSDGSVTREGFKLRFQALQIPFGSNNTWNDIGTSSCSGIKELRGTSGILELTSDMYTDNKDCEWTIVAPEGLVLNIHWLSFHLEVHNDCNSDWVKVVDLYRPNPLIYRQKLCGSPGFLNTSSWITSGNKLKVTFHSDGSVTKEGFKLRFQAFQIPFGSTQQTRQVIHNDTVPSTCSGHKVVEGTWGQLALTSYTNNKDCSWVVETPPGSVVLLRWLQFSLEHHGSCNFDWVKVTDLSRPSTLVYGKKLCGRSEFLLGRALTVATNRVKIAFHSDGSNVDQGFRLEYQALQVPTRG